MINPLLDFRLLDNKDYCLWDEFVRKHQPLNLFSLSSWVRIMSKLNGATATILAGTSEGEIRVGLTGALSLRFGIRILEPPMLTPYNGIIMDRQRDSNLEVGKITGKILKHLGDICDRAIIINHPKDASPMMDEMTPGQVTTRYTSIIDLGDAEAIGRDYQPDVRNKLNKANRAQINVIEKFNPRILYSLMRKSLFRAKTRIRFQEETFCQSLNEINENNWLRIFFALKGENFAAAMAIIQYERIAYCWLSATDPVYYRDGAGPKLTDWILRKLSSEGLKEFDFMGINLRGVGRYKESFGGQRREYTSQDFAFGIKGIVYKFIQKSLRA